MQIDIVWFVFNLIEFQLNLDRFYKCGITTYVLLVVLHM